ncbi:hypothetical protein ACI47T_002292 [Vibrio parahaemolyticus]|uniref:hypothetical protein n=1 Tax=Vibrio parahaemolyticus TaxID=670 RepID=UPI00381A22A0
MTPIEHIKRRLKGFAPAEPSAPDLVWSNNGECCPIEAQMFPAPELLLFLLRGICEFPLGYRGDKTHWIVPFTYKGINYAVSHEKFGLRIYVSKGSEAKPQEVLGKLKKALESAEKHILRDFANEQIQNGNITIYNQFNQLDGQYRYFRDKAKSAYTPQEDMDTSEDVVRSIAKVMSMHFEASRDGGYNSLAMIDAYFSRLEHFLVLALPFVGYDRQKENLSEFVGLIWSDKIRRVLNIADSTTQQHYYALVQVKEKYRNTFAHGGFEKNGQSFFFHLGQFGAIPASMSGRRDSVHFNFFPIDKETFEGVCILLDAFDTYLSNEVLSDAWKFAQSGLNLAMDEKNLSELLEVIKDPDTYDAWIDRQSCLSDMYANADY